MKPGRTTGLSCPCLAGNLELKDIAFALRDSADTGAGSQSVLLQDDRYPPAVPYPTLQEQLNGMEFPLNIRRVDARLDLFTFIWETTHINRGTLPMRNVRLSLNAVSNAPGNEMKLSLQSGLAGRSRLNLSLSVRNDKKESTQGKMRIDHLDASKLDSFVRPLFGATVRADFHQIDYSFKGDKQRLAADFCMQYDNLAMKAWNDASAPYRFVAQNSGIVSFLANLIVPKSNPAASGKEPKRVDVEYERDPMKPYPSYLIRNLTEGMLRTVLPGGKIHKAKQ